MLVEGELVETTSMPTTEVAEITELTRRGTGTPPESGAPRRRRRRRDPLPLIRKPPSWYGSAACVDKAALFFPAADEPAGARALREGRARRVCQSCPVMNHCRAWARANREYGYWGGETEAERSRAGFGPAPLSRSRRSPSAVARAMEVATAGEPTG